MKALAMLFGLVVMGCPRISLAADLVGWPCDGCTSQQMLNLAVAKKDSGDERYVYNLSSGVIVKYKMIKVGISPLKIPTVVQPENWVIDQFIDVHNYFVANGKSLASRVAANGSVNSYDVVNSSQTRNAVSTELSSKALLSFTATMASYGRVIRLAGVATPDADMTTTVNFPDGSKAIFKFNWGTKKWEYVPKSAIDSHGNTVPETAADFTNNGGGAIFDFEGAGNASDRSDFLYRGYLSGVKIIDGRGGRWACSSAGGNVVCDQY